MPPPSESDPIDVQPVSTGPSLKVSDVLYIVFRHKWLILVCSLVGLGAAAVLYSRMKPGYMAVAKLLVRAVVDTGLATPVGGGDQQVRNPDSRGEGLMNAEVEILTSKDLAHAVVEGMGVEAFKTVWPGLTNRSQLAAAVLSGIEPQVPKRSTTITVTYRSSDPELAQRVLTELVDRYLAKHLEIHRSAGVYETLARNVDQIRSRLEETEKELQQVRARGGVAIGSFEEAKVSSAQKLARIGEEVRLAYASLSEQQARLREFERGQPIGPSTNSAPTNATVSVSDEVIQRYRQLAEQVGILMQRRTLLLTQFTPESVQVQQLQKQIDDAESQKAAWEKDHPLVLRLAGPISTAAGATGNRVDLSSEHAQLAAIQAKIQTLTNQLELASAEARKLDEVSYQYGRLEQQRNLDRTNLVSLSAKLEQAKFDEALDPSRVPNISVIQKPSLFPDAAGKRVKVAGGVAFGGFGLGLALAFLIELVLDQRVRKPSDVETRLGLPLLLSIPMFKGLGRFQLALPARATNQEHRAPESPVPILPSLLGAQSEVRQAPSDTRTGHADPDSGLRTPDSPPSSQLPASSSTLAPWQAQHALRPYFEALRDRMMLYFQLNRMHHKPKLVAVAGCGEGSGATTIAAGLAASLSETGDGNVLLVDMNLGRGAIHPFFRGRPGTALTDALEPQLRDEGQVQEKLFVASAHTQSDDADRPLPKRLHTLMPKMRASDYDYIIFDMPSISETSATVALAASMDQVLLVVEGDKTLRGEVKRSHDMLRRYGANVVGVFNKHQDHAPKWLSDGA